MHAERRVVSVASPPAGAGFTFPVSGAVEVEIQTVSFVLTTSAGVANRNPKLDILDGLGAVVARFVLPLIVTATHVTQVTFAEELTPYGANDSASMGAPIPALRLYSGMSVVGSAVNIAAADHLTGIRLFVKQWPVRDGNR